MNRNALVFEGLVVKETNGYYSFCPELNVASQGDSIREAKSMLKEAVAVYLEDCLESNMPYLRPTPNHEDPRTNEPRNIVTRFRRLVDLTVKVHA